MLPSAEARRVAPQSAHLDFFCFFENASRRNSPPGRVFLDLRYLRKQKRLALSAFRHGSGSRGNRTPSVLRVPLPLLFQSPQCPGTCLLENAPTELPDGFHCRSGAWSTMPRCSDKSFRKEDGGAGEGGKPFFKRVSSFPRKTLLLPAFLNKVFCPVGNGRSKKVRPAGEGPAGEKSVVSYAVFFVHS